MLMLKRKFLVENRTITFAADLVSEDELFSKVLNVEGCDATEDELRCVACFKTHLKIKREIR